MSSCQEKFDEIVKRFDAFKEALQSDDIQDWESWQQSYQEALNALYQESIEEDDLAWWQEKTGQLIAIEQEIKERIEAKQKNVHQSVQDVSVGIAAQTAYKNAS